MNSSSNSENYINNSESTQVKTINYSEFIECSSLGEIELKARKNYYFLRKKWSLLTSFWITVLLIFDCYLTRKVGIGEWDFEKYPWLIHEIIVVNFGQLIGMGFVIVKFLFNPFLQYINQSKESSEKTSAEFLPDNNN